MILIKKSEGSAIAVERKSFQGADYIDVRSMYKTKDSDEFLPTKKGVMVPVDCAKDVAQAILDACSSTPKDVVRATKSKKPLVDATLVPFKNPVYVVVRKSVVAVAKGSLSVKTSRMFESKNEALEKLFKVDGYEEGKYVVARVKYGYIHITNGTAQFLAATFKIYGD